MVEIEKPPCPKCTKPMGKAGYALSGFNKVQRYRCFRCGVTTTRLQPNDNTNHISRIKINLTELQFTQLKLRSLKSNLSVEDYILSQCFREH